MEKLPKEIRTYIFKQLTQYEWVRVKRVCKAWYSIIMSLWIPLIDPSITNIIDNDAFMDLEAKYVFTSYHAYATGSVNMVKIWVNLHKDISTALLCSCINSNIPVAMYALENGASLHQVKSSFGEAIIRGLGPVVEKMLEIIAKDEIDSNDSIYRGFLLIKTCYKNDHLIPLFIDKGYIRLVNAADKALYEPNYYILQYLIDNYDMQSDPYLKAVSGCIKN